MMHLAPQKMAYITRYVRVCVCDAHESIRQGRRFGEQHPNSVAASHGGNDDGLSKRRYISHIRYKFVFCLSVCVVDSHSQF